MNMAVPNPGSRWAIDRGCTCPVFDNYHGKGYMGGITDKHGKTVFVYSADCPVHPPLDLDFPTSDPSFGLEPVE